jgi:hypothetical protein
VVPDVREKLPPGPALGLADRDPAGVDPVYQRRDKGRRVGGVDVGPDRPFLDARRDYRLDAVADERVEPAQLVAVGLDVGGLGPDLQQGGLEGLALFGVGPTQHRIDEPD